MPPLPGGLHHFHFEVAGEHFIDEFLGAMAALVGDLTPAWDTIHDDFIQIMKEQFASNGARGPMGKWDRYSGEPVYRYIKGKLLNANWGTFPILRWVATNTPTPGPNERLYPSFIGVPSKWGNEHVWRADPGGFTVGSAVPYAEKHQVGRGRTPYDKKPLPMRRIIDLTQADTVRWRKIIQATIMQRLTPQQRVLVRGWAGRQSGGFAVGGSI